MNKTQTPNKTNKNPLQKLNPTLTKIISGILLAGISIILNHQYSPLIIDIYAHISPSNQEYKVLISVRVNNNAITPPGN